MNKVIEYGLCNYTCSSNGQSICVSGYLNNCDTCAKYDFNLTIFIKAPDNQLNNLAKTYCNNPNCCKFLGNSQLCVFCNKKKIFDVSNNWTICDKCITPLIAQNKEYLLQEWAYRDKII